MEPFGIDGAWKFTPHLHGDDRASFAEAFRRAEFAIDPGGCGVSDKDAVSALTSADFTSIRS